MKKFLSVLILVIVVLGGGLAWFVTRIPASPFDGAPAETASADMSSADLVAKGEYVARAGDCVACHSTPGGKPFAGGLEMATPLGSIYATNITPDPETGIGAYSLADFDRALRQGVARDGHRLYPAMPYPSYATYTDEDVRALYAFFQHGVKPVVQQNHDSEIPAPMNQRWPLALWNAVFAGARPYAPVADKDAQWNRGAYLVQGGGHCGACHTPRGAAFNEKALDHSSPAFLSGALLDGWYAPSLRADPNTGLGRWSEAEIQQFLKTGRNQHAVVFGSMAEAFNNSTQFMTDEDLAAIAHYLVSLPGDPARDGAPWSYDETTNAALTLSTRAATPGAQTYMARCAACHGPDGRGKAPWIPPLAGAASMMVSHGDSAINVTLNGSARVVAAGVPDNYRMPAFREHLSDQEVAEVLSFLRGAWGNQGGKVAPADVASLRARTDPASSEVILLQMR